MMQCLNLNSQEILRRLYRFVSTNVYEFHVAGRFTGHLIRAAAKVR